MSLCFALLFCFFSAISSVSICDSYSLSLGSADQTALITSIVTSVFREITTNLPNPDLRYFNGVFPYFLPKSTNYTDPAQSAKLNSLVSGLVSFFGSPNQGLGCVSFVPTNYDLKAIHKNIYVTPEAQEFFIQSVVNVMQRAGVQSQDLAEAEAFLRTTNTAIVSDTICSDFANYISPFTGQNFLNESDFVLSTIMKFAGLVTQPNTFTKRFFDGRQPAGSKDLTAGGPPLADHLDSVHKYFGGAGLLSCLGEDFPKYSRSLDNKAIHATMMISPVIFDQWVGFHLQAFQDVTKLPTTLLDPYKAALLSFKSDIATAPDTICNKYAWALKISGNDLVTTVVVDTFNALVVNSDTNPFFTGVKPPGSTDFTTNSAALQSLAGGLVAFFGGALGCGDDTVPPYNNTRSIAQIHVNMGISDHVFDVFNFLLVGTMKSLGVSNEDGATVAGLLETFREDIVQRDTICNRYSKTIGVTNLQLLTTVVDKTVKLLVEDPVTLPYFNGQRPRGSTDFISDTAALASLEAGVIAFFGQKAVLGCSDGTVPKYSGGTLDAIHQKLIISNAAFDHFNGHLLDVLIDAGVASNDINKVAAILESTRPLIAAKYSDDDFRPNYLPGGIIAAIVICSIILALIFVALVVGLVMIEGKLPKFH